MKICVITCYNQPDYVRAKTLRRAFADAGHEVIVVKNSSTGLFRYAQVLWRLMKTRRAQDPDAYVLTFRGYEVLLAVRLLTRGKPLIYDEFINPIEWVVKEARSVNAKQGSNKIYSFAVRAASFIIVRVVASKLFKLFYRKLVQTTERVITDTDSHAKVSAELTGVPEDLIIGLPVGTDEMTFENDDTERPENDTFTVMYYGSMLPLHGLNYVIDAAVKMNRDNIKFILIGGDASVAHDVAFAVGNGANIEYKAWVDFEKLPAIMRQADLCLAGPFGGTFQAQYVVTGKAYQFMAMARPIVVGKNEESHVFTDKKNALIVKQASVDSLVETLRWAMENEDKLDSIGKAGRKLYDEKFSSPALAIHAEKLLAGLAREA